MDKIKIYFESLSDREKKLLYLSSFIVLFIVGYILLNTLYEKQVRLNLLVDTKIKEYNELLNLTGKYLSYKGQKIKKTLNLSQLDRIAQKAGVKENIKAIKPIVINSEKAFEISMKGLTPSQLQNFLNQAKKEGYTVEYISINNQKLDNKFDVRITVR